MYDSDGEKVEQKGKKKENDSDDDAKDGYAYFRKNNVEEDAAIAETVTQGMAEHTEFQVQFALQDSKKARQK